MTAMREALLRRIWHGTDPFAGIAADAGEPDLQGWGSDHPYLAEAIAALRPAVVVEIGVWKGGSTLAMARALRAAGIDGVVVAVDTWLGGWDHWLNRRWFRELRMEAGAPRLMGVFMRNVVDAGLTEYVLPLPLDSNNARVVLGVHRVTADLIHLDAGHDERAVTADLEGWWPLLRPGGVLIGDDYEAWAGVRAAFDGFAARHGMGAIEHAGNKCRIGKQT